MTATATEAPAPARDDDLEHQVALVACGTKPGKTRACDIHQRKARTLLNIASHGAVDAVAAAICNSEIRRACGPCTEKATEIHDLVHAGATVHALLPPGALTACCQVTQAEIPPGDQVSITGEGVTCRGRSVNASENEASQ
jgi:hypothetical protein